MPYATRLARIARAASASGTRSSRASATGSLDHGDPQCRARRDRARAQRAHRDLRLVASTARRPARAAARWRAAGYRDTGAAVDQPGLHAPARGEARGVAGHRRLPLTGASKRVRSTPAPTGVSTCSASLLASPRSSALAVPLHAAVGRPIAGTRHRASRRIINAPVADVWKAWTTRGRHRELLRAESGEGRADARRRIRTLVRRRRSRGFARQRRLRRATASSRWSSSCSNGTRRQHADDPQAAHAGRTSTSSRSPATGPTLTLRNFGYGDGDEWAKTKAYFEKAWPAVMASLEKRFAQSLTGACRWISDLPTRSSSSPARARASASRARRRSRAKARASRSFRAAAANLDAALARCRDARTGRSRSPPTCAMPTQAARMIDDVEAALGPIDVLVNSAGAAKRYRARRLVRAGVARRDGREVLQLHPSDRHRRQADGRARPRRDRQHHRHGRQGREPDAPARRRGQRRADARDRRTRRGVRAEGRARQRDQSRRHAHRAACRRASRRRRR